LFLSCRFLPGVVFVLGGLCEVGQLGLVPGGEAVPAVRLEGGSISG